MSLQLQAAAVVLVGLLASGVHQACRPGPPKASPDDAARAAQQKVYEDSFRVQCMAADGTPDCSHIERQRRQQLEQELEKRYPGLALQRDLQDRQKKHFERPPGKEMLKSDHVRSI